MDATTHNVSKTATEVHAMHSPGVSTPVQPQRDCFLQDDNHMQVSRERLHADLGVCVDLLKGTVSTWECIVICGL